MKRRALPVFLHWLMPLVLLMVTGGGATGQPGQGIEEEDLPPDTFTQLTLERIPLEALEIRFQEATREYLEGSDAAVAVPTFTELIDLLVERRTAGVSEPGEERLLAEALSYRSRVHFNLAEVELAELDLLALVEVDPSYMLDPNLVSPKLVNKSWYLAQAESSKSFYRFPSMSEAFSIAYYTNHDLQLNRGGAVYVYSCFLGNHPSRFNFCKP